MVNYLIFYFGTKDKAFYQVHHYCGQKINDDLFFLSMINSHLLTVEFC